MFFKLVSDPKTSEPSRKPHLLAGKLVPKAQRNISETRPEVMKENPEKPKEVVEETKRAIGVPMKLSETPKKLPETLKKVPETPQRDPEEPKKALVAHKMVPEPPVDVGLCPRASTPPQDLETQKQILQAKKPQQQGRSLCKHDLFENLIY